MHLVNDNTDAVDIIVTRILNQVANAISCLVPTPGMSWDWIQVECFPTEQVMAILEEPPHNLVFIKNNQGYFIMWRRGDDE